VQKWKLNGKNKKDFVFFLTCGWVMWSTKYGLKYGFVNTTNLTKAVTLCHNTYPHPNNLTYNTYQTTIQTRSDNTAFLYPHNIHPAYTLDIKKSSYSIN